MRLETSNLKSPTNLGHLPDSYDSDKWTWSQLADRFQPKILLELGTGSGTFLSTVMPLLPDSRAITVNYPPEEDAPGAYVTNRRMTKGEIGASFHGSTYERRIQQIYCDTRELIIKRSFDLIMIDANHDTDYVISDTKISISCCRDDSIILWHDFHPTLASPWICSVRLAIETLGNEGYIDGLSWFENSWTAGAVFRNDKLYPIDL